MKPMKTMMGNYTKEDSRTFKKYFGVPLVDFVDVITGFDIVKFDEFLKVPEDKSLKEYLTSEYNEKAAKLIDGFISKEANVDV